MRSPNHGRRRRCAYWGKTLARLLLCAALPLQGQELDPGAYSVAPVGVNAMVLGNNFNGGDMAFDPSGPIRDAKAKINVSVLAYARALDVGGRSANITVAFPYVAGHLEGLYIGEFAEVYRSGLGDPRFRFAINLHGAPAMSLKEFAGFRGKTSVALSFSAIAPLGQYDPAKLINIGTNRWSFKPELGVSQQFGKWTLEYYGGVWFFTDNKHFFGGKLREQDPVGITQFHVSYTFRPRLWVSFNTNFYFGGRTTVSKKENLDLQTNSRVGATVAIPLNRRQSLKVAYSRGAYTTIGGDFHAIGVAYQYIWGAGL